MKILLLILFITLSASAQTIHKAKLTPAAMSETQKQLVEEGTKLHDEKKFDEAIALYKRVIGECPDCVVAVYEIGLSYFGKKDYKTAMGYLEEGTKYKSSLLPDIYRLMGSIVDNQGDRQGALDIYDKALKIAPNSAILRYDIGVTYARISKFEEARASLKKSVELDPGYVSPHYILSEVFIRTKYRIPAMLAAGRVLSLESDTARSKRAGEIFMSVFQGGVEKGDKPGSINIFLNLDAPEDEGDFGSMELVLGLSGAANESEDKEMTDEEKFISKLNTFVAVASETKMKSNFVKDQYFSFLLAMKSKAYIEPFAYLIMHQNGNKKADAWISANGQKMIDFINWAKAFKP